MHVERWAVLFALLWVCTPAHRAHAEDRDACVASYEQAQSLRRSGSYMAALERAQICAKSCPERLARDCAEWARELDGSIASVLLSAIDGANHPISGARVSIDGSEPSPIGNKPLKLDPGKHTFAFVTKDGRVVERTVALAPGERSRRVVAIFPKVESAKPEPEREVPLAAFVVGGVGLAALTVAGALAIAGHVERGELESTCGETATCTEEEVAPIRRYWAASGVLAAVGGSALAVGVILTFVLPSAPQGAAASVDVVLGPARAAVGVDMPF